ncbi:MAG: amidohydrolase family protein [Clostridiales bacterium]|nr:amidohydrolase family protein [Clostridiales bacterium]
MALVKKIDIHVHTISSRGILRKNGNTFALPHELREMYDKIGVEKGVLLPIIKPEQSLELNTNREIRDIVKANPESFAWFCGIDPRQGNNAPDTDFSYMLEYYKSEGAKGVGEMLANIYFDDERVFNFFHHCEKCNMPVIFHIGNLGRDYGLVDEFGLPRLEKALKTFPKLRFLGHSQKFWAEISGDLTPEQRDGYPTGKVTPGGRVVELMRNYPNLYGDLSAGSGYNAVSRDPEFGYGFIEEFQDRLYYGTDICDPANITNPMLKLASFLDEGVTQGKISQAAYEKVSRINALKLLEGDI